MRSEIVGVDRGLPSDGLLLPDLLLHGRSGRCHVKSEIREIGDEVNVAETGEMRRQSDETMESAHASS